MTIAEGMTPARRRPTRPVAVIAIVTVLWTGLLIFSPGSERTAAVASNIGLIVAALGGAAAALRRSRRTTGDRRAWLLLGLGALSWGLGQSTYTVYEQWYGDVPVPSWADVGYLTTVPLLVAGLLSLPGTPGGWQSRLRLLLDGALVAAALLAISWTMLLGDLLHSGSENLLEQVVTLAYPVGDVVCGSLAVVNVVRARTSASLPLRTLLLISLALLSFSVGDTGFALLTWQDTYQAGRLIDLGWFCGWALLAVAALQQNDDAREPTADQQRRRLWLSMSAPYVPVLAMVVVNGYSRIRYGAFGLFVVLLLLGMLVLIIVRHALTQHENDRLTGSLEARVETRTRALSGWEQWWRALVQNSTDVVTVLRDDGTVKYQTPSIRSVFGYDEKDLDGTEFATLFTEGDRSRFRTCLAQAAALPGEPVSFFGGVVHDDGRVLASESTVMSLLHDEAVLGLVVNTRDVSERSELETELNRRAFHDELTGLANRALFRNRLSHALEARARLDRTVGVLFVDLDRFKEVNDTLGHAYGDELLCAIASRLVEMLRPGDTVARLGGDEFAVLLEHLGDPAEAEVVAARLVELIEAPVRLRDVDVQVRASVGIALAAPDDAELAPLDAGGAADVILRNGDIAMYRAKGSGGGSWESYRPELHAVLMRRVEIEKELRSALRDGELSVVYQPTASVQDGRYVGVEALVRWDSARLGRVTPTEFIPVAEDAGLIIDLGAWVLHHACSQAAGWLVNGLSDDFSLAVNVSGHQLLSAGMVETVRSALAMSGLPGRHLVLEMTESVLLDRTEQTLARLHELKGLGIRLAIDDFGTGYSSLSYLSRFPVDVLKVDRSFIARIQQEASNELELTRTIVQLGGSLDMLTVAEGVETPDQLATLRSLGCDLAQGYLFSEPRPGAEIERLLSPASTIAADAPVIGGPVTAAPEVVLPVVGEPKAVTAPAVVTPGVGAPTG